jgi:hypothetical protein
MKIFEDKKKNTAYFFYRLISPIIDPIRVYRGITGYAWFVKDYLKYKQLDPKEKLINQNLFPILHEKTPITPFDAHYFYQQLWSFEKVYKQKSKKHVDIGSTYEMSGYISKITKAEFVDIRPIKTNLKNLNVRSDDILNLGYKTNSLESLSCLHVVEHIGLGRYGDAINPKGTEKACKELQRVLAKEGRLYFSTPIGNYRVCFNAHKIHTPDQILEFFNELTLVSFSVIDDNGNFIENVDYKKYRKLHYGCGLFEFTKR